MFFAPQLWIYAGLLIFGSIGWVYGNYESNKYDTFKAQVLAEGIAAKDAADRTNHWNNQVIKETNEAYQKRLDAINTKYGRLHQYSDSNPMPRTDTVKDTAGIARTTADNVSFERDCTITTNMLVSLQDIIKKSDYGN
jgi:hypothetical protein